MRAFVEEKSEDRDDQTCAKTNTRFIIRVVIVLSFIALSLEVALVVADRTSRWRLNLISLLAAWVRR